MKDCEIWPQQSKGKKAAITSVTAQVQNPGGRMVVKQFIGGDIILYFTFIETHPSEIWISVVFQYLIRC